MAERAWTEFEKLHEMTPPRGFDDEDLEFRGLEKIHRNSYYLGQWNPDDQTREGFGYYVYPDGGLYAGMWKNDKREGLGRNIFGDDDPQSTYYEGDFEDNEYEG